MPKLKPGTLLPSEAEDKAITRAARRDPDAKPLTEAEWKRAKPHARVGRLHGGQHPLAQANRSCAGRHAPSCDSDSVDHP